MQKAMELWKLIFDWLGNGKKVIMGLVFIVMGVALNWLLKTNSGLTQSAFLFFTIGGLFFVNALFSKLTHCNINVLLYTLVFVVIMELGMYLMNGLDSSFTNMVSVWGPCFLFVWALQYVVLQVADMEPLTKRLVIAFFDTLVGAIAIVAAFIVPVFLTV